jgi:hypothetical protein
VLGYYPSLQPSLTSIDSRKKSLGALASILVIGQSSRPLADKSTASRVSSSRRNRTLYEMERKDIAYPQSTKDPDIRIF